MEILFGTCFVLYGVLGTRRWRFAEGVKESRVKGEDFVEPSSLLSSFHFLSLSVRSADLPLSVYNNHCRGSFHFRPT